MNSAKTALEYAFGVSERDRSLIEAGRFEEIDPFAPGVFDFVSRVHQDEEVDPAFRARVARIGRTVATEHTADRIGALDLTSGRTVTVLLAILAGRDPEDPLAQDVRRAFRGSSEITHVILETFALEGYPVLSETARALLVEIKFGLPEARLVGIAHEAIREVESRLQGRIPWPESVDLRTLIREDARIMVAQFREAIAALPTRLAEVAADEPSVDLFSFVARFIASVARLFDLNPERGGDLDREELEEYRRVLQLVSLLVCSFFLEVYLDLLKRNLDAEAARP